VEEFHNSFLPGETPVRTNPTSVAMPATVEYFGRNPLTYESAVKDETNVLKKLEYSRKTKEFLEYLKSQKDSFEALTTHHLGLSQKDTCTVLDRDPWIQGSFNVCVPVEVKSGGVLKRVLIRCAMLHKLAEAKYSGTVDEKIGCEVGAYAWMQANCADVHIPHLFGFGFKDGRHVRLTPSSIGLSADSDPKSYSSPTRCSGHYMSVLYITSAADPMPFSDIVPLHITPPILQNIVYARDTWFPSLSNRARGRCSPIHGRNIGKTQSGSRTYFEA
jgi:hypothetical protein